MLQLACELVCQNVVEVLQFEGTRLKELVDVYVLGQSGLGRERFQERVLVLDLVDVLPFLLHFAGFRQLRSLPFLFHI